MTEESDDELPANWEAGKTNDGRIFYVDHHTQRTQWEHPITGQVKFVPKGKCVISPIEIIREISFGRITIRLERNY